MRSGAEGRNFAAPWWPGMLFGALALWLLTYPFDFQSAPVGGWLADPWVGKLNTLSNVIMFFPFGLLVGWAAWTRGGGRIGCAIAAGIFAFGISLIGETLQVWLPDRHSAVIDLAANTFGAALGAIAVEQVGPMMSRWWQSAAAFLSDRPAARGAVWLLALWGAVRTWPFNFAVETYYLRLNLEATREAGMPFTSMKEIACGAATFAVTLIVMTAVCRALRETFERRGDRGSAAILMVAAGAIVMLVTELLHWPIRGRVMDLSELLAGWSALPAAALLDAMMGSRDKEPVNPHWWGFEENTTTAAAALGWVAVGVTVLTVYGSLVPLTLQRVGLGDAVAQFREAMTGFGDARPSRADAATNFVLFGAMAFAWMAVAGAHVRDAAGRFVAAGIILGATVAVGAGLEFVQLFIVERTTSPYDVIAQLVGGAAGLGAYFMFGSAITGPLERMLAGRAGAGRAVLTLYLMGYLFYAVMPLDIVMSPGELIGKFASGRVRIIPFTYDWPSAATALWDIARDVTLAVPIGIWAVMVSRGTRGAAVRALAVFVGIEFVQLFLASRVSDTTDVVTGLNGAAIGAIVLHFARSGAVRLSPAVCAALTMMYALGLVVFYWLPFDLDLSRLTAERIGEQIMVLPLTHLYMDGSFPALDQMLVKILVVVPLGMLIASAARSVAVRGVMGMMVVMWLSAIELVQVASVSRVADSTDVMLGCLGLVGGLMIGGIVRREAREEHGATRGIRCAHPRGDRGNTKRRSRSSSACRSVRA